MQNTMSKGLKIFTCFVLMAVSDADVDPTWIEPHAWGKAEVKSREIENSLGVTKPALCSPSISADIQQKAAPTFYKKLVRHLFNPNQMELNEASNTYTRIIKLELTKYQVDVLQDSNDLHDWDVVISQALLHSENIRISSGESTIIQSLKNFVVDSISASSELKFTVVLLSVVFCVWLFIKKYKCRWFECFLLLLSGAFLFGFIHTYYDCNRRLETDELIRLLEPDNPCEAAMKDNHWFWSFFVTSKKQDCITHLRNQHKIKLPFCRPDEVILTYMNDVIFHQMGQFLSRTGVALKHSFRDVGVIHTIIASILLIFMCTAIWKPACKYFLHSLLHRETKHSEKSYEVRDTISGNNLKLFLQVVNSIAARNTRHDTLSKSSGVEIIQPRLITQSEQTDQIQRRIEERVDQDEKKDENVKKCSKMEEKKEL